MTKQLCWFYPTILELPSNTKVEAAQWHRSWLKLTGKPICLVDSTGLSRQYGDGLNMAYTADDILKLNTTKTDLKNGEYWHHHFPDLMERISNRIFALAHNKSELRLCYSGGTDSTLALAALLSNPKIKFWTEQKKFIIYTTPFAKVEDPVMWNHIVGLKLPMKLLDYDELNTDTTNALMVTGDGDGYCTWWQAMMSNFTNEEIFSLSYEEIKPKLSTWFLTREPSGLTWEYFNALQKLNYTGTDNLHQAWAWFEQCVAIQCYIYRPSAYGRGPVRQTPREDWYWFMTDRDFWDMCDWEAKNRLYRDDKILKYTAMKFIANYLGYDDILPKGKYFSQWFVPKIVRKFCIFDDLSYSNKGLL